jgi:hypothetical protein
MYALQKRICTAASAENAERVRRGAAYEYFACQGSGLVRRSAAHERFACQGFMQGAHAWREENAFCLGALCVLGGEATMTMDIIGRSSV